MMCVDVSKYDWLLVIDNFGEEKMKIITRQLFHVVRGIELDGEEREKNCLNCLQTGITSTFFFGVGTFSMQADRD